MHIIIGLGGLAATLDVDPQPHADGVHRLLSPGGASSCCWARRRRSCWSATTCARSGAARDLAQALRYHARAGEAQMIADLYRFGRELKQGRTVEAPRCSPRPRSAAARGRSAAAPAGGRRRGARDGGDAVYARLSQVKEAEEVFRFLARTTPAVGLMGTIVGLVNMLMNLKNFEQLGPGDGGRAAGDVLRPHPGVRHLAPFAKRIENYGRKLSVSARLLERGLTSIAEGRSLYDLRLLGGRRRRPVRRRPRDRLETGPIGGRGRTRKSSGKASPRRGPDANDLLAYGEEDDTSWLIPYVDVVSLLLAFLILALAMSKVNLRKFELVSAAISHQAPPPVARRAQGEDRLDDRSARADPAGEDRRRRRGAAHGAEERAAVRQRPGRDHADRAHRRSIGWSSCSRPSTTATRSRSRGTPTTCRSTPAASTRTGSCRRRGRSTCSSLHRGGRQPAAALRARVRRHAAGHARSGRWRARRRAPAPKIAGS